MRVVFAPEVGQDLNSAVDFLADRSPTAAAQLLAGVRSLVQRLANADFEGPQQQLRSGEKVRSWPLPPYRLYYQRTSEALRVVRTYHQARRPIAR